MRFIAYLLAAFLALPAAAQDIQAFANALNAQRQANGLPALSYNPRLSAAAQAHADDMVRNGFISHTGSDGTQPADRARRAGYCWRNLAENIAWQIPGEANVVTQWMGSAGHRRNILDRRMDEFGVARSGDNYWVLVLGRGRNC